MKFELFIFKFELFNEFIVYPDFHNNWVSELQQLFDEDRYEMTELYISNMEEFKTRSKENEDYLKTIIFAQDKKIEAAIREDNEYYSKRNYETIKNVSIKYNWIIVSNCK